MVEAETSLPETGQSLKGRNSLLTNLEIRPSKIHVLTSGEDPVLCSHMARVQGKRVQMGLLLKSPFYHGVTPFMGASVT